MKKRSMSLLLVLVMVFSLLPFSAMATVFPVGDQTSMLEIKFFKGDTEINSQRAAKDSVSLYDPGCPVEGQEVFRGWKIAGQNEMLPVNATEEGEADIASYVEQNYDNITSPLRVNAVLTHVRYLVYMDENDRVLKTDYALEENGYEATVNLDYVPTESNQDFFGWATAKNAENPNHQNGEQITLDADKVTLYPVCKAGYWLSFDNNLANQPSPYNQDDTRASFTAPKLYVEGEETQEPTAPTRPGYRLEGWYTDQNLTQKYTFGGTLSDDMTLYAKWVPSGTVDYQVVIWKQNASDDPNAADGDKTYSFAAGPSVTRTAQAGSMVSISNDDTQLVREAKASNGNRNITMGTNEKWNFFKYNANNTDTDSVMVKGDGSTVLNVYYDRVPITINFWSGQNSNTLYYNHQMVDSRPTYHYDDKFPSGYYMIGKDGPWGSNYVPPAGSTVYSFDDMRKDSLTASGYNGTYFEYTTKSPDASNTYNPSDTNRFYTYGGNLFHKHNYWLAERYFAQFYYYENRTGDYLEGEGPEWNIQHTDTQTSGTHYYYHDDSAPSGYYRVGDPSGPRGNWQPQTGDTVYSSRYPYWKKWQHKDGGILGIGKQDGVIDGPSDGTHYMYISDADATGNYKMFEYTYSAQHSQSMTGYQENSDNNWNSGLSDPSSGQLYNFYWCTTNGLLYIFSRPGDASDHRYRAVYYHHENKTGYYEVGTGPNPDAPGTVSFVDSTYTGLYGAEFNDWITYNSAGEPLDWALRGSENTYPMPVFMFDNFDEGDASSGQATTMNLYPNGTTSGSTVHYQGQTVDGSGYEDFLTFKTSSNGRWYPTEQFVGFTIKDYKVGSNGSWNSITSTGSFTPSSESWVRFTRHQNHFIMMSETDSGVSESTNEMVYYQAPLNKFGTMDYIPENGPTGTYFDGWYADPAHTIPFDFNATMPDNDVRVYAKWTTMRFRVVLDPINGAEGVQPSDINFGGNQVTAFRLDYGEKIGKSAIATATRSGYQLTGWEYVDRNGERQPFNFDYNTWDQIADFDYDAAPDAQRQGIDAWNGNAEWSDVGKDDVVGKVTIYAKWRHVMGDNEYLTVAYDAAPGTLATSDTNHYADMASAIALPAPQAPAGFTFSYWQVLGTDGQPTGVNVTPGHTYDVRLADAVNNVVTLKAVYAKSDTATHITWVGNGGTTEAGDAVVTTDTESYLPTDILSNETFKLNNAEFLGWARLNENEMKDGDGWKLQDLTADDLFLIWNESEGKYYVNHNVDSSLSEDTDVAVTQIAADEIQPYHVLYAVWDTTENHNYVIDFNGKMTIATDATEKKGDTHNNGAFEIANDGKATYQLKAGETNFANGANLAFNGIDTALINGIPVGSADGTKASWEKYTVIPANNVYFDDSLVGKSMTVGDGSGYNAEVSKYTGAADGQSKTTIEITFTGDGIDVYCTTPNANGWIQATVDGTNKQPYTNTKYEGGGELHNIPVISFRDLGIGTHTLVITTLTGANFQLDGIRVYNGMQDAKETDKATVDSAYEAANEQNLVLAEVRQYLLDSNTFGSLTADDDDTKAFTGALFIDTKATGADVADYTAAGPKNEVYLNAGQGIAFQIQNWSNYAGDKIMVGLSVPKGGTATVAASGRTGTNKITVNSETHMYYQITPDATTGNVYIYNTAGSAMVSITDLKITGPVKFAYTAPPTVTPGEPAEGEGLEANFVVSKSLRSYVMSFDPEAEIEDPVVVDEPDTPDTPDNPNPIDPMAMLKALFEQLLKNLFNLFSGLGNW